MCEIGVTIIYTKFDNRDDVVDALETAQAFLEPEMVYPDPREKTLNALIEHMRVEHEVGNVHPAMPGLVIQHLTAIELGEFSL